MKSPIDKSWADDGWNDSLSKITESSADTSWADDGWNDSFTQLPVDASNAPMTLQPPPQTKPVCNKRSIGRSSHNQDPSSARQPRSSISSVIEEQHVSQAIDIWLQPTQIVSDCGDDSSGSDWDEPIHCSTPVKSQRYDAKYNYTGVRIKQDYDSGRRCSASSNHDIWSQETRIPTPEDDTYGKPIVVPTASSVFRSLSVAQENTPLFSSCRSTAQIDELSGEDRVSLSCERDSPPPKFNRRKGPIQYSETPSPTSGYVSPPISSNDEDDKATNVHPHSAVINRREKRKGAVRPVGFYRESSTVYIEDTLADLVSPESPPPRLKKSRGQILEYTQSSSSSEC